MSSNPCLVWHSIPEAEEGAVEYPFELAKMLGDAPVYVYSRSDSFAREAPVEVYQFGTESTFAKLVSKTPLAELYRNTKYATWKPPADHDVFVTRGPKPLHTVQRLSQRHVHVIDGSYRGFFLHKDAYDRFHGWSGPRQFAFGLYRLYMRTVIQGSIHTVDDLVVNSEWTSDLVESLYNRQADEVIYPPMTLETYSPQRRTPDTSEFYLYLGLVDRHHRIFELLDAFADLDQTLKIAGDGSAMVEAQRRATDNVEFCGYVTGEKKRDLLADAKALVNPANHSFGRAVVEALASGTPVISLDEGYPSYILDAGETGYLYQRGVANLLDAVGRFERDGVSATAETLAAQTDRFSRERQRDKWRSLVGLST